MTGQLIEASPAWPRRARWLLVSALTLLLGWQVVAAELVSALTAAGDPAAALALERNADAFQLLADQPGAAPAVVAANARRALALMPLDQHTVTLLAQHSAAARRPALLGLAGALGWRDRLTQLWLAQVGLDQGDVQLFAQRFDAFGRLLAAAERPVTRVLDNYIVDPRVRAAVVPRLALRPLWRPAYLGDLLTDDGRLVAARLDLLDRLARAGASPTRVELLPFSTRLLALGLDDVAFRVWRRFVHPGAPTLLTDGAFAAVGDPDHAFAWEWTINSRAGAFAQVEADDHGGVLHVHTDGNAGGAVLSQQLALAPGSYGLMTRANADPTADGLTGLVWSVRCQNGPELMERGTESRQAAGGGTHLYRFDLPAGCVRPTLALAAVPDEVDHPVDLWLVRATLARAGSGS